MFRTGIRGRECDEKQFEFVFAEISFNYFNHILRKRSPRIVSRDPQGQTNGLNH